MAEAARVVRLNDRRETRGRRSSDTGQRQVIATRNQDIPPGQLACRVRHRWPMDEDLTIGGPVPRGVEVIPKDDGTRTIREKCKRRGCPKHRMQDTLPGGIYDPHAPYRYDSPQDWVVADASLGMSPRTAKAVLMRGRQL